MQIAPVGAVEVSLASLNTGVSGQGQIDQASVGQNSTRSTQVNEKREADQAQAAKASSDAADVARAQTPAQSQSMQNASSSGAIEPGEALTKRELFDYLAEVERNGPAASTAPTALMQSAVGALDGTLQKISATLEKAQAPAQPGISGAEANAAGTQDASQLSAASQPTSQASQGTENIDNFAIHAEQMLERSMSVMWAAANLEVVMGSVSAVTSSTSTLIKQQ